MMIRNGKKQQQQHLNKVREENRLTYPFQQWGGIKKKREENIKDIVHITITYFVFVYLTTTSF